MRVLGNKELSFGKFGESASQQNNTLIYCLM